MKLSKSLLQAILVGATLGASTPSCTKIDDLSSDTLQKNEGTSDQNKNNEHVADPINPDNCPACGMG